VAYPPDFNVKTGKMTQMMRQSPVLTLLSGQV
jgi:hypothetical protein